jgi:SAM-dependent methyltransferase
VGCGTGVDTLEMAEQVAPGEIVGVDCSAEMLRIVAGRAAARALPFTAVCADAASFLSTAEDASFDAITLRFCLAYLDWPATLPALGRLLRPGGRVGILTNLASSAPQAYAIYRRISDEVGMPPVTLPVPDDKQQVDDLLRRGGLRVEASWTHRFRLWFDTGAELADWLQESGFVTHPALTALTPETLQLLVGVFTRLIEGYREPEGIPLDFELAGVVAVR